MKARIGPIRKTNLVMFFIHFSIILLFYKRNSLPFGPIQVFISLFIRTPRWIIFSTLKLAYEIGSIWTIFLLEHWAHKHEEGRSENTHRKGKYTCTTGLQFNGIGFDQRIKYAVICETIESNLVKLETICTILPQTVSVLWINLIVQKCSLNGTKYRLRVLSANQSTFG